MVLMFWNGDPLITPTSFLTFIAHLNLFADFWYEHPLAHTHLNLL